MVILYINCSGTIVLIFTLFLGFYIKCLCAYNIKYAHLTMAKLLFLVFQYFVILHYVKD